MCVCVFFFFVVVVVVVVVTLLCKQAISAVLNSCPVDSKCFKDCIFEKKYLQQQTRSNNSIWKLTISLTEF